MTTDALRLKAIHQKATLLHVMKINWKAVYFLALAACVALIIFYIFEVNQLTQGSFLIKNYNKEVKSLLAENRNLQTNFGQASFWQGVQDKAQSLNFEKTTQITYIKILKSSLAEVPKNYQK